MARSDHITDLHVKSLTDINEKLNREDRLSWNFMAPQFHSTQKHQGSVYAGTGNEEGKKKTWHKITYKRSISKARRQWRPQKANKKRRVGGPKKMKSKEKTSTLERSLILNIFYKNIKNQE